MASNVPASRAVPISQVHTNTTTRELTGIGELDRVLGGGLVPGVVVLLAVLVVVVLLVVRVLAVGPGR